MKAARLRLLSLFGDRIDRIQSTVAHMALRKGAMHTLAVRLPRSELRPYVRTFVQRRISVDSATIIEPTTAQLEPILAFDFGTPVEISWYPSGRIQLLSPVSLGGAQTSFSNHMHLRGGVESFGVFFRPTGFSKLFRVPICELTNCAHDATNLTGKEVGTLWNRMSETGSFEQRVLIAEEFLIDKARHAKPATAIAETADNVFCNHGAICIADLARLISKSLRHFEREFTREIGASPKRFARVARFQAALDAKVAAPDRTWIDIAHSFGYHDQMHMIHDFETLGHDSPGRLVCQLGDSRPPAMSHTADGQAATVAYLLGPS